ncbi:ABC transporter substrate-binding protein [Ralstonia pickettii DTP0602]|nr:ABC transporter substrate-binding protein [Ralstonia pickettii DTP0602]
MISTSRRHLFLSGLALCATTLASAPATAQGNGQPVRLVVGYAAGGPADQAARLFAVALGKTLNANVIVDNKPGANATLAGYEVVRAKPDGATLWFAASAALTVAPNIMKSLPYDPAKDLTPVAPVARYYNMLVANNKEPFKSTQELVAYAKAHPGKLSYGSSGVGSSNHVAMALFARQAQVELNHIPYKGNAPAMTDTIGGQIDMMFDIISTASGYVQSGKVKPIAVGSPKRNPSLPNVPTFREAGIPALKDYEAGGWYAIYAPKGVAPELTQKLAAAVRKAVEDAGLKKRYAELGYEQWSGTTQDVVNTAARERTQWASVLKGVTLD